MMDRQSPVRGRWRRRAILGSGAGAVGVLGTSALLYRAAPGFWQQYRSELGRPIASAAHVPDVARWSERGLHAAWLGHSTVLIQMDGLTILTDPVFSARAGLHFGPMTLGVKRLTAPALALDSLPRIDLVLLSHAHMDHFDIPSLRKLESKKTSVVTALKTGDLLRAGQYAAIREVGWGQEQQIGPVRVRGVEVNHWGARMRTDTYRGYNGYLVDNGQRRILFAGDTADTDRLRGVAGSRPIDLVIMPIGAYNPWIRFHCTPEQAWRMSREAGGEYFLPVHHSTFQLSREPRGEPIERLYNAAGAAADRIALRQIGEEFRMG